MSKHKLTRDHILRKAEEISHVLRQRPSVTQHFSFHKNVKLKDVEVDSEKETRIHSRLGLAIPKKMAKRAVDRNKIKRLIRESFRKQSQIGDAKSLTDLVVKLKFAIGKKTRGRLRESERQDLREQINQKLAEIFHD